MTAARWTVVYYERSNGRCPTESFLSGLSAQDRVRVNRAIARLEAYGHTLGMPYIELLRDGIWELRVRVGRVRYRLFFFFHGASLIVLTHGIIKKSGQVADSEIEKALEYRADYVSGR